MAPREDRIVVLTTGSRTTRAGHGIQDLFQQPTVRIATRVGKTRQNGSSSSNVDQVDASAYIVGAELDALLANARTGSDDIEVIYPIRAGKVRDWDALVAVWRHVLIERLGIRTAHNDCPLLVSLPATLSRSDLAKATQLLFENFNVPSLGIAEEPVLSAYAAGTLTATVVDYGWEHCTVTPIIENQGAVNSSMQRSGVGMRHVCLYLAHLLSKDESVVQALIKVDATREAQGSADALGSVAAGSALDGRLFELATLLLSDGKLQAGTHSSKGGKDVRRNEPDEEAEFDVAAALVAGREKAAVEEQERKNKATLEAAKQAEQGNAAIGADAGLGKTSVNVAQVGASSEEGAETVTLNGARIRVAPQPLQQACDVLWDPTLLGSLKGRLAAAARVSLGADDYGVNAPAGEAFVTLRSLQDTVNGSISSVLDTDRRQQLWETLLATGAPARLISNMNGALIAACQSCLASNADSAPGGSSGGAAFASAGPASRDSPGIGGGEVEGAAQPSVARCIKTPDYFAEYKDRTDLAPFLGATIYAKLAFTDPYGRLVTTKAAYNERGPSASFTVLAPA